MTLTQHGPSCDVCDNYILLEPSINPFSIFGVGELHAHLKCKQAILALDTSAYRFWDALPKGRVRQLADDIWERDERERGKGGS
jgi:hypothetical protein